MIYEDFSLKIEPKQGEIYPIIVLRSPAGEGRSSFRMPFNPGEIGDILFDLGQTVRGTGRVPLRDISPAATRTGPQQIGDQLFNALFAGPVRSLLDRSLGMLHGSQHGLRIKLHIDPEDPSLAQLASLPWEFMYRKETRDFLNLSRFTPILRYLDVQRPYIPLPLELPLRILVIISAPTDYVSLDLDGERALIEASWAQQEGVQVEFMERATILTLQDQLADKTYHVLHYMGHGGFDERTGQGVLVMEDEDGRGATVDGSTLGILLRDLPTMRIVFLNACETARVTKEKGLDPFAGVAASMVMAGIPAVVAMQFPITDRAAITFAQKFYPLLARGDPVDAAVAEGRRAIRLAEARTMEWGTPVLFMRAPEGVIFRMSEAQREKVPVPQIPELPEEFDKALEQRLTELYTRGLSAFWLEEWEKAAHNFQTIVDVQADYEDAADKLVEAKRQANLHTLYAQAQAAQEAEDWPGALAALEELAAEAEDFKDTTEWLQTVKKQKQLADLFNEAQQLHQAQQWQAIVNVFSQIHALEPDFADPDELLRTAEREVAEQKRLAELQNLYSHAVREMDADRWQEAHQLLAEVQEMETGFRETERLLARVEAEIEREEADQRQLEQVATMYERAAGLAAAEQWRQVLEKMEEIQALDPQFADPEELAPRAQEEVDRQRRLNALYAQAQAAQAAEDWMGALSKLEELVAEAENFQDAPDRLETVKKQKQLADLYAEARQQHQTKQWPAVVNTFAQILAIEPEYPDPEGLLPTAEREMAMQKRQAELNGLYDRAVNKLDAEHWVEARRLLDQLHKIEPGYRETARLLIKIEAKIERVEAERQRQEQIATLYEQALGLARAKQWGQVLEKTKEIQTLDPQFVDQAELAVRAQKEVAREEEETRRQSELAVLYAEAVRLLRVGQYQDAMEKWGEVRARDPRYPDRQKVQAKARKKLATLGKPKLPGWLWMLGGAFVIITMVVGFWIYDRRADTSSRGFLSWQPPKASGPTCMTPPTGLTGWWPGDGNADELIAGRTGIFQGNTTTESGLVNLAFNLDGDGDFVEVPHNPALNVGTRDFTIDLWVNFMDTSGEQVLVEKWIQGDPFAHGWTLTKLEGDILRLAMATSIDGERTLDSEPLALRPSIWYHIAATRQGSAVTLFLNGESIAHNRDLGFINLDSESSLKFGHRGNFEDTPGSVADRDLDLNGRIDEVELFVGTALSADQILAIYQAGSAGKCKDASLLAAIPSSAATETAPAFSGEVFFNHGVSLYDRGDYEEAIAQFNQALALGWETAELYHARGHSCHMWHYFQSGCSLEQAIADSTKAIELEPLNPDYWNERGDAYMDQNNPRAALNDFNQSIQIEPQNASSYVNRGSAYNGIGEEALAINDWINAIALDPQACDAYTGLGNIHRDMGDYQLAIENLSKAIEICPTLGHNYIYRGWIYFDQLGDPTLALSDFSKAIEAEPDKHSYYFERGHAYELLGQMPEARADYEQYLELTEGYPDAEMRDQVQQWLAEHPE